MRTNTETRCAVGAALTSRYRPDLPESLVDFFATRAKALLEVEMDSPTLSTVQSLAILSGVEALLTRDARGWLYSGMCGSIRSQKTPTNHRLRNRDGYATRDRPGSSHRCCTIR